MIRAPALLCLLLTACASAPRSWHVERVLDAGEKLNGCAAGDVMPDRPGTELVAVAASGAVLVAWHDGAKWRHETAFQAPGEMIQVACGDVLPQVPGAEIAVVGMAAGRESSAGPGAAFLIRRVGSAWRATRIKSSPRLLHGTVITRDGVVVTGFANQATLIRFSNGKPIEGPSVDLPGAGKTGLQVGNRVAIACNNGSLVGVDWSDGSVIALDARASGRARLGSDGERIAVADDDGTLSLVAPWGREEIHKESKKLRGAVFADLDPETSGVEAACAGYENKITVLRHSDGAWQPELVHESPGSFHHLFATQLDASPGLELVACGFAGELLVIRRR